MKVLQVNCVFRHGSTGKIVADIHDSLQQRGIESVVCYGRGETITEPHVYKTCGEFESHVNHFLTNITGLMYGGNLAATKRLERIIQKETPDLVHLHCINGHFVNIYRLIQWLKEHNIKTVLTLHAEFMHTANCGHALECVKWKSGCGYCPRMKEETGSYFWDRTADSWKKMKSAFEGFGDQLEVVSVSPWLMERAKQSPILSDFHHSVIYNGVDTNVFHYYSGEELRKKHGFIGKIVVFHATPYFSLKPDHIKGGYYVFELAKKMVGYPVQFVIAGTHSENMKAPENVLMLGKVSDQHLLAKYYAMADITLLTSRKETFSMVTAESLCCGTPVVGFQAGAPEQIVIPEFGRFVPFGDLDQLEQSILKMIECRFDKMQIAGQASMQYGKSLMCKQYVGIYEKLCQDLVEKR